MISVYHPKRGILRGVSLMYNILLVEDDENICEMIVDYFLAKSPMQTKFDIANDGETGLVKAYENKYDLLLLDVMLPEVDGFEICKEIRRYSDTPIVFITARTSQEDMLRGYALGCDDYIVKPFLLPVFHEKVRAVIKRSKGLVRAETLEAGAISLNPTNGIVEVNGEEVKVTAKEYTILKILLENKNRVVPRETLISEIWGYDSDVDNRVLDTHLKNLRKALGAEANCIKTIVKRGFRIED